MIDYATKCPHCGSDWVVGGKRSIASKESGSLSSLAMTGKPGIMLGFAGNTKESVAVCRKCGKNWKPGDPRTF